MVATHFASHGRAPYSHRAFLPLYFLLAMVLGFSVLVPEARGEMVGTEQVAAPGSAEQARVRMTAMLARPEAARQMNAMGVPPEEALARINAMSDAEVQQVASNIAALPAGGSTDSFQTSVITLLALLAALAI
jgi:hypothetical protein